MSHHSSAVTYHQVSYLLEKMNSADKDYRFMATNDLMTELQNKSITLDDGSERSIIRMLLKLLDDKNGEVQNLAVKCLGPLVGKVKESNVDIIVEALCTNMESTQTDKEHLRDISSMGLKTIIPELEFYQPASSAVTIMKKIMERLMNLCVNSKIPTVTLESIDIISDALALFGANLSGLHKKLLLNCLYPHLAHERNTVRKKSINAICNLVLTCSPELFFQLFNTLLENLQNYSKNRANVCTMVQCMNGISRRAGHRLTESYLSKVVPILLALMEEAENDDEMKESCLQTFEAFIRRCPREVETYSETIIQTGLTYLSYDPNYSYDDDEGNEESMQDDEEEDDEFNEFSDDDDISWKVRRASAKVLEAVIASKPNMATQFFVENRAGLLVSRFKEREETVKEDIFQTFVVLLKQTKTFTGGWSGGDAMETSVGPVVSLQQLVPAIMREIKKLLKLNSVKTRQGVFMVLNELVLTLPGCLADQFAIVVPGIDRCFDDKSSTANLKLDCLSFISTAIQNHAKEVFYPYLSKIVQPVIKGVKDKFYRITADSLSVLKLIVKILKPVDDTEVHAANHELFTQVFDTVYAKLKATDLDQEVKENAILCMAQILYNGGDTLNGNLQACLKILVERLHNEITRVVAVKSFTQIASSPRNIQFEYESNEAIPVLIGFLRKNQRSLRLCSVECLLALIRRHGQAARKEHVNLLIEGVPQVLNENDLQITQTALNLLTLVVTNNRDISMNLFTVTQPIIINLLKSPVLQGAPLDALLYFVQALFNPGGVPFETLYKSLHGVIFSRSEIALHKQAYWSVSKTVALLAVISNKHPLIVQDYCINLEKPLSDNPESVKIFCLLTIGEIGKQLSLSGHAKLPNLIMQSFDSSNEELKNAASVALGYITANSVDIFLPFVLDHLKKQPKKHLYLLLQALREFIVVLLENNVDALKPLDQTLWGHLMAYSECAEEGTRNLVAECLGKLTLLNYDHLEDLRSTLSSSSPSVASTIVTAVKFTIVDKPHGIDAKLRPLMGDFLSCLKHENVNVRRLTLVMLNSAAHNKASLIRNQLDDILKELYQQTLEDKSLIKLVEMGPFKHEIDMGLDLRKTAFECMYTLLETCLDKIPDIFVYLTYLQNGLRDHYDIKMLAHLMLIKLSVLVPGAILQRLDKLMEAIRATIMAKVKADSVKQEFDKQEELKRSALRAVHGLLKIPECDRNPAMIEFLNYVKVNQDLNTYFETLKKEDAPTSGFASEVMDTS
jgi:cullin-associated NEDD8-dissociated protein 1